MTEDVPAPKSPSPPRPPAVNPEAIAFAAWLKSSGISLDDLKIQLEQLSKRRAGECPVHLRDWSGEPCPWCERERETGLTYHRPVSSPRARIEVGQSVITWRDGHDTGTEIDI